MKNLVISCKISLISLILFSCHTNDYRKTVLDNVTTTTKDLITKYDTYLERIDTRLMNDTLAYQIKNSLYRSLSIDGRATSPNTDLISLISSLYLTNQNKDKVQSIRNEYRDRIYELSQFFITHKEFNETNQESLEVLKSHYQSLRSNLEELINLGSDN